MKTLTTNRVFLALSAVILFAACNHPDRDDHKSDLGFDPARASKEVVSIDTAIAHRKLYHISKSELSRRKDSSFFKKSFDLPEAEAFSKDAIMLLLSNPNAKGIRAYLGNNKGKVNLILVPVDAKGEDIIKPLLDRSGKPYNADSLHVNKSFFYYSSDAQAVESQLRCPQTCNPSSPLN